MSPVSPASERLRRCRPGSCVKRPCEPGCRDASIRIRGARPGRGQAVGGGTRRSPAPLAWISSKGVVVTSSSSSLSDKRILLTGGTTGIGRATLALLVDQGARVLTFGRDERHLVDALRSVESGPGRAIGLAADIATREGVVTVFEAVDARLGGLDILVACAALGAQPIQEMAEENWRYVIDTNLVGYMACARAAMKRFAPDGGHLLFVGSISSEIKAAGESVYSATKAGVQAFAETLRKEVGGPRHPGRRHPAGLGRYRHADLQRA